MRIPKVMRKLASMKQVIINNPHNFDLTRFHLDWIIGEALNIKDNSEIEDYEVMIAKDVEIINCNQTRVCYDYRGATISVETRIEEDVMTIDFVKKAKR